MKLSLAARFAAVVVGLLGLCNGGADGAPVEGAQCFRRVRIVNFSRAPLECIRVSLWRGGKKTLDGVGLDPIAAQSSGLKSFGPDAYFGDRVTVDLRQKGAKQPRLYLDYPGGGSVQGNAMLHDVTLYVYDEGGDQVDAQKLSRARLGLQDARSDWKRLIRGRPLPCLAPKDGAEPSPVPGGKGDGKDPAPSPKKDEAPFLVLRLENKHQGKKATASATVTPKEASQCREPFYYSVGIVPYQGAPACDLGASCDTNKVKVCVKVENANGSGTPSYYAHEFDSGGGLYIMSVNVTVRRQDTSIVVEGQAVHYSIGSPPAPTVVPFTAVAEPCGGEVDPVMESCDE